MTKPLITSRTDWSNDLIYEIYPLIEDVALNDLKLDVYRNQIEVISAEQMIDAYASVGLPVHYNHWSFGKEFLSNWQKYQKGKMGLAYEIVINSDPCISYLMEENNAITQALVIAHAAFGHNSVFKNNYMFKEWTSAGSIIDYMQFAKNYIRDCELKYGEDEVERVLDAVHALASHGVDKRKRRYKKRMKEEDKMAEALRLSDEEQQRLDIIIKKTSFKDDTEAEDETDLDLVGDEENLIYFIYKNAPSLEQWKREIMRIIYKIRQYFYPQSQTKVLNEGFASFTHYYIMDELEKKGIISPDAQIAWLHLHSNVVYQPSYNSPHYSGFNPYALGISLFNEIRRVCEKPTKEDEEWFPNLVGTEWRDAVKDAMENYRDESFIEQFMTPNLIRKLNLFSVDVNREKGKGIVTEISDDMGYRNVRGALGRQYNMVNQVPDIVVHAARMKKDRTLILEYRALNGKTLYGDYANKTLNSIKYLWGHDVEIIQMLEDEEIGLYTTHSDED